MNSLENLSIGTEISLDKLFAIENFGKSLPKVDLKDADNVELAQTELPVKHHFSLGIYARELYIPKGAMLVGKLHKLPQLNILLKGKLSVLIGNEIKIIEAPFIVSSEAGTKRIAYAQEDSIWLTLHATDETDLDKIENLFIAQNKEEYLEFCKQQLLLPLG